MCHSTASQDFVTTRVTLTDSTAGTSSKVELGHSTARKYFLRRKLCHSIAGQDLATDRVALTVIKSIQCKIYKGLSVERAKRVSESVQTRLIFPGKRSGIEVEVTSRKCLLLLDQVLR